MRKPIGPTSNQSIPFTIKPVEDKPAWSIIPKQRDIFYKDVFPLMRVKYKHVESFPFWKGDGSMDPIHIGAQILGLTEVFPDDYGVIRNTPMNSKGHKLTWGDLVTHTSMNRELCMICFTLTGYVFDHLPKSQIHDNNLRIYTRPWIRWVRAEVEKL